MTTYPLTGPSTSDDLVLRATDVRVEYAGRQPTKAVRGVSLELRAGEVLGIAGESGCGKSTLAYALTRMLKPPATQTGGQIEYIDRQGSLWELGTVEREDLRRLRWAEFSMVFQSAMNALNPVSSIGSQFDDVFRTHRPDMDRAARRQRGRELLEMVGIDPRRIRSFPHELSGGMRQRVVIALALALEPRLVVMDEPTTALDVLVQREILDEIERLRRDLGFAVIFITHDLGLLLEISDSLAVMYAGEFVEYAPTRQIAEAAQHPYTQGLLRSFPSLRGVRRDLRGIPGNPPDLRRNLVGCPFRPRCEHAFEPCESRAPILGPGDAMATAGTRAAGEPDGLVACHLHRQPPLAGAALKGSEADERA